MFLILFLVTSTLLFARGRGEEEAEIVTQNDEWILSVTNFDLSALPEEKLPVAGVITRLIVERLNSISYRTRVSEEFAYYKGFAWSQARSNAARQLAARQTERANLLFRGEQGWRHRQNLARVETEIERLRTAFEEADENAPLINEQPLFRLTQDNLNFIFPPPPQSGMENNFAVQQRADGFLTGKVIDFHGRFYVLIRLYTVFTRSFVYEDSIIFSANDIESAMDELASRLVLVLSGGRPAVIIVRAEPEEALVLINKSFAGRGEVGAVEFPPGRFIITASAENHEPLTLETELSAGDTAHIDINLSPIQFSEIYIPLTTFSGNVYLGALYVGETPLTLRLPVNTMEFIEVETFDGNWGTAVFQTPIYAGLVYSLPIHTVRRPAPGRVERARRQFYWTWGTAWVTGIAAWVAYHSFVSSDFAIRYNHAHTGEINQGFMDNNIMMYYVSMGTLIAFGTATVLSIVQMVRYTRISTRGSAPIRRLQTANAVNQEEIIYKEIVPKAEY